MAENAKPSIGLLHNVCLVNQTSQYKRIKARFKGISKMETTTRQRLERRRGVRLRMLATRLSACRWLQGELTTGNGKAARERLISAQHTGGGGVLLLKGNNKARFNVITGFYISTD